MNINEILSKLVAPEQLKEATEVLEKLLSEAIEEKKAELEKEFDTKLQEAYEQLTGELKDAEQVAEKGYNEAYGIIADLRNRLETQRQEFESALEEGYEEAFQMILQERAKKEAVQTEMYEEYDKKLAEMREYFIDKIDEFMSAKGKELYEQVRRDVLNDPQFAEHRIALNKVVETVSEYISDEDYALATSAKLEQAQKENAESKSQMKVLEARNIRLSTQMTKLEEQVRQNSEVLKEHTVNAEKATKTEKNERVETAKKAEGRGKTVVTENVEVIKEPKPQATTTDDKAVAPVIEGTDWTQMAALAGIPESKPEEKK
jgi:hypothetical protein